MDKIVAFESILKPLHFDIVDIDPIDDVILNYRIDVVARRLRYGVVHKQARNFIINRIKESIGEQQ
jgi:hypothetical protein